MDTLLVAEKKLRLASYSTGRPRAARLSPSAAPILTASTRLESRPGVPVLLTVSHGRESRTFDRRLMGRARKLRFARCPGACAAYLTLQAAIRRREAAERTVATDQGLAARDELASARQGEDSARYAYFSAQLGS